MIREYIQYEDGSICQRYFAIAGVLNLGMEFLHGKPICLFRVKEKSKLKLLKQHISRLWASLTCQ